MKRTAIATMVALVLAGCGEDEGTRTAQPKAAAAEGTTVRIKTFIFSPDPIKVAAGEKITFVNEDATTHTVTAGTRAKPDRAAFDARLAQGDDFARAFDKPGEYDYFCDLHSGDGMVGKIVVE